MIVNAQLMKAVVKVYMQKPDRSGLQLFQQSTKGEHNEKEVCGILSYMLEIKAGCRKQLPVGLDVLRWADRCCIPAKLPARWKVVEEKADIIMEQA